MFHNGSVYDCHFIIKGLTNEFKGQCECFRETKQKNITFSVSIKKSFKTVKNLHTK